MGKMIQTLKNAMNIPDLRKKLGFTLFILILYRIGAAIPIPGIDSVKFAQLFERFGQLGSFMDIISGGAFKSVSLFALGITPYINASIMMQLLTVAIPALERLSHQGEDGRKKIQRYTRYFTVVLAFLQAFFYWNATKVTGTALLPQWLNAFVVIGSFTAGSAFIMWLGEQINDKGIGNGISLLIFAGIVSRLPSMLQLLYGYFRNWQLTKNYALAAVAVVCVFCFFIIVVALVVFIHLAERKIPVQYAKRVVGRKMYGGQSTYLPIRVNQAGVMPVIFAVAFVTLPSTIASFTGGDGVISQWFMNFSKNPLYYVFYSLLILGFTFFYSMISFNPLEISNNLQRNGGFIPGIRPGKPTAEFVSKTARRLNWINAMFLILIVILPVIASGITGADGIWFGGTAILIIVGVVLDLMNELESQMMMRHHKGFLD